MPTRRQLLPALLVAFGALPLTAQATGPKVPTNEARLHEIAAITVSAEPMAALEAAAEGGDLEALAALSKHFRDGSDKAVDLRRAIDYDRRIVEGFAHVPPHGKDAATVTAAMLRLADTYARGVPDAGLGPRKDIAQALLTHGASVFGDGEAQYRLGVLLLESAGEDVSEGRQAARWLLLAARKGHVAAQVALGQHLTLQSSEASRLKGAYWLETAARSGDAGGRGLQQAVLAR